MEADSEYSICVIECLLHSIPMMNVNIQIQDSRVNFQQLKNAQNNIIHITKSTCLCLFSVMKTAWPIYYYVTLACDNEVSSVNTAACCQPAEIEQPLKSRAIECLIDFEDRA